MSELRIKNLSVKLANRYILKDISFSLKSGELLTVLGINGCGKTTLLKALAGLIPSNGEFKLDEINLMEQGPIKRAQLIAFLPQIAEINSNFLARDIIAMGRYPFSKGTLDKEDIDIIDRAINLTKCSAYLQREIQSLSGGERQRVLLASAIAQQTKVLLLDEPLNFMDPAFENEYQIIIKELALSGLIIIQVSHNLNASLPISDSILAIKNASLNYYGDPRKWLENNGPQDLFNTKFTLLNTPQRDLPVILNG